MQHLHPLSQLLRQILRITKQVCLPEHKVAPVVFGAGEFEHKRFCMDVSTNPREEKHDSGASGTSISENKSVFGGHRTKV